MNRSSSDGALYNYKKADRIKNAKEQFCKGLL